MIFLRKSVLFILLGTFNSLSVFSQTLSSVVMIHRDTAELKLQKIIGIGPLGLRSIGLLPKSLYPDEEKNLFPELKNIPEELTNFKEYLYLTDPFQFYYQNYCRGYLSKEAFLKKISAYHWKLADTLRLSRNPVKCLFSAATGTDSKGREVYIVDAANNSDYGDDVIRPLNGRVPREDIISSASVLIQTEKFNGKRIETDTLSAFIFRSTRTGRIDNALLVLLPQFKYSRLKFQGRSYVVCYSGLNNRDNFICVLPDQPNFTPIRTDQAVYEGQSFTLNNITFTYAGCTANGLEINLTGKSVNELKAGEPFSNTITQQKEIVFSNMIQAEGAGPIGNVSLTIPSRSQLQPGDIALFPVTRNIPANLKSMEEYFFIVDEFQFYYQNYRSGRYAKELFLQQALANKWPLPDTVNLSNAPLRCGFSVVTGITPKGNMVYIADQNNNNDYSDDAVRTLIQNDYYTDQETLKNAVSIELDTFSGGKKEKDALLVSVVSDAAGSTALKLMFPSFKYSRFTFNDKRYIICSGVVPFVRSIWIVPDTPNFVKASPEAMVSLDQFIKLEDQSFQLSECSGLGNVIRLLGRATQRNNPRDEPNKALRSIKENSVSNQVGFIAPEIAGINITEGAKKDGSISLSKLKGKYVFVDFWSTACGPCIAEFKYINEAYERFGRDRFEVLGVAEERQKGRVAAILREQSVKWPNIKTDMTGVEGYRINSYPSSYLVDPKGRIVISNLRGEDLITMLNTIIN